MPPFILAIDQGTTSTRADLADALERLVANGVQLDGASDHGVSEALYLRDPDGNGIELYWDRPQAEWPVSADGKLSMHTRRLDVEGLLREADRDNSPAKH